MQIPIQPWLSRFSQTLAQALGPQLLFLGLQGSYGRCEAGPDSDIDLVTVLEQAGPEQLRAYRDAVARMPDSQLACGFLCGRAQLAAWPKFDLLQLKLDTRPILGSLDGLLPPLGRSDLLEAVRIGAANLYHGACHGALYSPDDLPQLRALYKSAFFVLRLRHLAQTGRYLSAARDLLPVLTGDARALAAHALRRAEFTVEEAPSRYMDVMIWAGDVLTACPTEV